MSIAFEVILVFLLILANGFLAMSEMALVSAKPSRLKIMAEGGNRGAKKALDLTENSGRFLSTVQVGITLIGVVTGAISGATIAEELAISFQDFGLSSRGAESAALALVIVVITFLSLIVGELVPKQIALSKSEQVAAAVATPMKIIETVARPLVAVLDFSSRLVLRVLGLKKNKRSVVTEEEINLLVAEATSAGVVEPAEKQMIGGVLRLGNRSVRTMMTHRTDIVWIDVDDLDDALKTIRQTTHRYLVACRGKIDDVIGVVDAKAFLQKILDAKTPDMEKLVKNVPYVRDTASALEVLAALKQARAQLAVIRDDQGVFEGIVTKTDIFESIAGKFVQVESPVDRHARRRKDGSWLLDGGLPCDEMAAKLGLSLPTELAFHTVAGFVLSNTRSFPREGDKFQFEGWVFEVLDMDGRKIDKVQALRLTQ